MLCLPTLNDFPMASCMSRGLPRRSLDRQSTYSFTSGMKFFAALIASLFVIACATEEQLFMDLVAHFRSLRPAYIGPAMDQFYSLGLVETRLISVFPSSYEIDSMLSEMLARNELDLIYFAQGCNYVRLLLGLDKTADLFRKHKVNIVVPRGQHVSLLPLRLDTRLYEYELSNGSVNAKIFEHYKIKSTVAIETFIGQWGLAEGIKLEKPHIWQRR